jgi:hypothetical protein
MVPSVQVNTAEVVLAGLAASSVGFVAILVLHTFDGSVLPRAQRYVGYQTSGGNCDSVDVPFPGKSQFAPPVNGFQTRDPSLVVMVHGVFVASGKAHPVKYLDVTGFERL